MDKEEGLETPYLCTLQGPTQFFAQSRSPKGFNNPLNILLAHWVLSVLTAHRAWPWTYGIKQSSFQIPLQTTKSSPGSLENTGFHIELHQ